jgi:L-amino acid N-acyltransferase YncA
VTAPAGFVRGARAEDAGELARVQVACWRRGYAAVLPGAMLAELTSADAEARWARRWREAVESPPSSRHRVHVAESASRQVTGFASAGPAGDADRWPGTDAELYELRVEPESTRQGHGGRLLHAVVDTLVSDGFHTVYTWVVEADDALTGFLESSGFVLDGARAELDLGSPVPAVRLHASIGQ